MAARKVLNRRERWRAAVIRYRGAGMNGEVRALLLYLADSGWMSKDAIVCIPQKDLAEAFDVPRSRISERIRKAHELGLLTTVKSGVPGRTASYQGCIPGPPEASGWRSSSSGSTESGSSSYTESQSSGWTEPSSSGSTESEVTPDSNLHGSSGSTEPESAISVPAPRVTTGSTNFPSLGQVQDASGSGIEGEISSSESVGGRPRSGRRTEATNDQRVRPISDAEVERDRQLQGLRLLISQEEAS